MSEFTGENPLSAIQNFDVERIPREAELGADLNFKVILPEAKKLIGLYKRISTELMEDIPSNLSDMITNRAKVDLNVIEQILHFRTTIENLGDERKRLIQEIKNTYASSFKSIHTIIAYGVNIRPDLQTTQDDINEIVQGFKKNSEDIIEELANSRDEAQNIIRDLREIAAEQGVSQQAIYFKEECDSHIKQSKDWRIGTIVLASVLGLYALASFFMHKIPWILHPETNIEVVQLVSSKILLFAVISYMLFLVSRNFMSHKHNAIVNKHRQNALSTFKALVDAAEGTENKDVILAHASACIFSPQDTGYEKSSSSSSASNRSVVGLIPKNMFKSDS